MSFKDQIKKMLDDPKVAPIRKKRDTGKRKRRKGEKAELISLITEKINAGKFSITTDCIYCQETLDWFISFGYDVSIKGTKVTLKWEDIDI